jgi:mRNA-degrading endonuclease toxin of MazEF toxin-antitoxin module
MGVFLPAGETGLSADSMARPENIAVARKENLMEPRQALRRVSDRRICEIAAQIRFAVGC